MVIEWQCYYILRNAVKLLHIRLKKNLQIKQLKKPVENTFTLQTGKCRHLPTYWP